MIENSFVTTTLLYCFHVAIAYNTDKSEMMTQYIST